MHYSIQMAFQCLRKWFVRAERPAEVEAGVFGSRGPEPSPPPDGLHADTPADRQTAKSMQHRLDRIASRPRRLTFDVEVPGAIEKRELPFIIGVIADLSGDGGSPLPMGERRFERVDRDNLESHLRAVGPTLRLSVPNRIQDGEPALDVRLWFQGFEDFGPARVASQVDALRPLLAARESLVRRRTEGELDATALAEIRTIDTTLSAQVTEILHAPEFRRLEATWRGLRELVIRSETSELLQIRVLNVRRGELLEDIEPVDEPDDTWLFGRIRESSGAKGDEPFGLLVSPEEFGREREDLALLGGISNVAAEVHAPFVAAATSAFFDLDRFHELDGVRDLARIVESPEDAGWKTFRDSDGARHIALTVPHILLRLPYGRETEPIEELAIEEGGDASGMDRLLWGSAAWMLAARVADSQATWAWPAAIRGAEGGGLVEGLSCAACRVSPYDEEARRCTDTTIVGRREYELSLLGFVPLCQMKDSDRAAFLSVPTCHKPRRYAEPEATVAAQAMAQLPVILAASRIIHYIQALTRDHVASFRYREEIERIANEWIGAYVRADEECTTGAPPRYPLREARIQVSPDPTRPGGYRGVAFLRFRSPETGPDSPLRFDFPIG